MPLPKCLDNVIRFHILSPLFSTSSSTGEVSIFTEPSMLPLTPSAFSKQSKRRKRELCSHGRGLNRAAIVDAEEGWEDGEDIELDDGESEGSEDGEDESDWTDDSGGAGDSLLEGRFQRSVSRF